MLDGCNTKHVGTTSFTGNIISSGRGVRWQCSLRCDILCNIFSLSLERGGDYSPMPPPDSAPGTVPDD